MQRKGIISSTRHLSGKRILVTRPRKQADQICRLIEAAGGHAERLALLDIAELHDNNRTIKLLKQLHRFDMGIFISANAVLKTHDLLNGLNLTLPSSLKVAAIGRRTARTLQDMEYRVDITPQHTFNSETFLAMPEARDVAGLHILIFKGEGGRDLLRRELLKRGAEVSYAEVYKRTKPSFAEKDVQYILSEHKIDLLTVTSSEALQSLNALITESGRLALRDVCLLTGSPRIAEKAQALNFSSIITATDPSDAAMFSKMLEWSQAAGTIHE